MYGMRGIDLINNDSKFVVAVDFRSLFVCLYFHNVPFVYLILSNQFFSLLDGLFWYCFTCPYHKVCMAQHNLAFHTQILRFLNHSTTAHYFSASISQGGWRCCRFCGTALASVGSGCISDGGHTARVQHIGDRARLIGRQCEPTVVAAAAAANCAALALGGRC
jgi:hypothetical protein